MNTQSNPKLDLFLSTIPQEAKDRFISQAKTIQPLLDEIHATPAIMYQNYYGNYMTLICQLVDKVKNTNAKYWGVVLLIAGANPIGVESAVKNL